MTNGREQWSSKFGFILAAAGSAVGLGNIWKFPHMAGENGGGAFTLIYLICILVVGLPILLAEFTLGRRTQASPVGAFSALSDGSRWKWLGMLGVASAFVILSFYGVIGGWTIKYSLLALAGSFSDIASSAGGAQAEFDQFVANPVEPIFWHMIFMGLTVLIILKGVKGGIEKWSKALMPILLGILIVLVIRGVTLDGAMEGIRFLFSPKWGDLTTEGVVLALGHSFFTISLGMGTMITYGSYLRKDQDLLRAGLWVIFIDTAIALLAGVAIFTAVFALGQNPAGGPGLIFVVLPTIFPQMPGGAVFGFLFFALLFVAALTSAISILEVVIAYFIDEKQWSRTQATLAFGGIITMLGIFVSLSFGEYNVLKSFGEMNFFSLMDNMSSKYMLPIGGFLTAVFVLTRWGVPEFLKELQTGAAGMKIPLIPAIAVFGFAGLVVAYILLYEVFKVMFGAG